MSNAWAKGSTNAWRRTRAMVLARDHWTCQLCGQPIDPHIRHPDPYSAQVHHTRGKAYGDDPRYLQAAHRICNQRAGDPTKKPDPQPRPMTRWRPVTTPSLSDTSPSTTESRRRCRMCSRPARWVSTRGEYGPYCNGHTCTNHYRLCQRCGIEFERGVNGAGNKYCSAECQALARGW